MSLQFRRTTPTNGVPAPEEHPGRDQFELLEKTTPSNLVEQAKAFLASFDVNKQSELGDHPAFFLLGEPQVVGSVVVSKVLNAEVEGWGPLANVPNDNGVYSDGKTTPGFYGGGGQGQVYVHALEGGRDFYDYITAAVVNGGIVFNTHSRGYAQAVYHEILHTFEGSNLVNSTVLKEGFVERFADEFRKKRFGLTVPYYPAYSLFVSEVEHLVGASSLKACALAYFGDDESVLPLLMPQFYEPVWKALSPGSRISDNTRVQAASCSTVKDYLPKAHNLKGKAAWYVDWVKNVNGGTVPLGGLAVPAARASGFAPPPSGPPGAGGFPPPPPPPGMGGGFPPPPPPPPGMGRGFPPPPPPFKK